MLSEELDMPVMCVKRRFDPPEVHDYILCFIGMRPKWDDQVRDRRLPGTSMNKSLISGKRYQTLFVVIYSSYKRRPARIMALSTDRKVHERPY